MIRVTSTMISCNCRCYFSRNRGRLASYIYIYINIRDHQNSAIGIAADTSSPVITEIDGKPVSARGYRACFDHFVLIVQCPMK